MTLLLLGVPVGEVPAGPHDHLEAGGAEAVGQSQLQLSRHTGALNQSAICAGATAAALSTTTTTKSIHINDNMLTHRNTCVHRDTSTQIHTHILNST